MTDLNPPIPFQTMSTNKDTEVEDTSNTKVIPVGGKTPSQIAQENRSGPATPDQADQFQGGPHLSSSDSNTPGTIPGRATNEQMRMAVSSMMTTQGMHVSTDFAANLDQLVQTGD